MRYLKSNMDRFIVYSFGMPSAKITDLKSNMDRFIALAVPSDDLIKLFKIQYG